MFTVKLHAREKGRQKLSSCALRSCRMHRKTEAKYDLILKKVLFKAEFYQFKLQINIPFCLNLSLLPSLSIFSLSSLVLASRIASDSLSDCVRCPWSLSLTVNLRRWRLLALTHYLISIFYPLNIPSPLFSPPSFSPSSFDGSCEYSARTMSCSSWEIVTNEWSLARIKLIEK